MTWSLNERELSEVVSQLLEDSDGHDAQELAESGLLEIPGEISGDEFVTYEPSEESRMAAVDGGSATVLDGGSFIVAGIRVGQVFYDGQQYQRQQSGRPESHLLFLSHASLRRAYEIFFDKTVGEEPTDLPRGLEEAVGRIRTLLEWKYVEGALASETLTEGSVLAFDGALWAGIKGMAPMLERIVDSARQKGVLLCGISKRSMLTHGFKPLLPTVQIIGEEALPRQSWFLPLNVKGYEDREFGDVFVAKLHPHSAHVFRVDMALPEALDPGEAFGRLSRFGDDPTYVGYPYPLARVHNDVAFTRAEVEELTHHIRRLALARGMDDREWHLTFQDFHKTLDINR